jgi:uncharacterized cupin superfamily protein
MPPKKHRGLGPYMLEDRQMIMSLLTTPFKQGAPHPVEAVKTCNKRRKQALGDAVGVMQFGVNWVVLDPGVSSSLLHWHSHEDEFVLVLEGTLHLVRDDGEVVLKPGDYTGFAANIPIGHKLENRSGQTAVYLEIGSRRQEIDTVTYVDQNLLLRPSETGIRSFVHQDGSGYDM